MASGTFVSKQLLIDQIRQTIAAQESAVFSLLTTLQRSVLLRFSAGRLIHVYCQGRHVDQAISAINECQQLKFVRTSGQEKDGQEVMQGDVFLAAIGSKTAESAPNLSATDVQPSVPSADLKNTKMTPYLQEQLTDIARDYIGLVANMLVTDICSKKYSLQPTIEQIAEKMPSKVQSDAFRERALVAVGLH